MNRSQRTGKSPRPPRPAFPALPRALRAIEVAWARRLDPAAKAYSELRPAEAEIRQFTLRFPGVKVTVIKTK